MRETVSVEQVARSATCAMERLRLKRASLICSPTTCIFSSSLRGSFVPIVFFAISLNLSYSMQRYNFSVTIISVGENPFCSDVFCWWSVRPVASLWIFEYLCTMMYDALCIVSRYRLGRGLIHHCAKVLKYPKRSYRSYTPPAKNV